MRQYSNIVEGKKTTSLNIENRIVQRTLYLPSAVGQPASHLNFVQTVRRIRNDGDDRQKN